MILVLDKNFSVVSLLLKDILCMCLPQIGGLSYMARPYRELCFGSCSCLFCCQWWLTCSTTRCASNLAPTRHNNDLLHYVQERETVTSLITFLLYSMKIHVRYYV